MLCTNEHMQKVEIYWKQLKIPKDFFRGYYGNRCKSEFYC